MRVGGGRSGEEEAAAEEEEEDCSSEFSVGKMRNCLKCSGAISPLYTLNNSVWNGGGEGASEGDEEDVDLIASLYIASVLCGPASTLRCCMNG